MSTLRALLLSALLLALLASATAAVTYAAIRFGDDAARALAYVLAMLAAGCHAAALRRLV